MRYLFLVLGCALFLLAIVLMRMEVNLQIERAQQIACRLAYSTWTCQQVKSLVDVRENMRVEEYLLVSIFNSHTGENMDVKIGSLHPDYRELASFQNGDLCAFSCRPGMTVYKGLDRSEPGSYVHLS